MQKHMVTGGFATVRCYCLGGVQADTSLLSGRAKLGGIDPAPRLSLKNEYGGTCLNVGC